MNETYGLPISYQLSRFLNNYFEHLLIGISFLRTDIGIAFLKKIVKEGKKGFSVL